MISGACLDSTFFEQRASPCCIWLWTPTAKDVGSTLPARCAGTIDRERASGGSGIWQHEHARDVSFRTAAGPAAGTWRPARSANKARHRNRSEEHTSELQSLMRISYDVICLKKKIKPKLET